MTLELDIEALVDRLFSDNKDVLFIDTCILLNVVRCLDIERPHLLDYVSAKKIISKLDDGTLTYNLVILSPINDEWNRNVVNIYSNAKNIIDKSYRTVARIEEVLNCEEPTKTINIRDFRSDNIEEKLKLVSYTLLEKSYSCRSRDDIKLKAMDRSIGAILPARKASQSLNDCILFEEILEIARALRDRNFTKKLVFSTYNTNDFGKAEDCHSSINQELSAFQIEYVTNLEWANSFLTNP